MTEHEDAENTAVATTNGVKYCDSCNGELILCPYCGGDDDDPGAGSGKYGYWICKNETCDDYSFCCGC